MTTPQLAIGPANYAGQADAWAKAVERHLGVEARSLAYSQSPLPWRRTGAFAFPADRLLPHHRSTMTLMKRWSTTLALRGVTHLAADGFLPFLDRIDKSSIGDDIPWLQSLGMQLALVAHGGDVRDPDRHASRLPFSYFRDAPAAWVDALRDSSRRNRAVARDAGLPLFVSTPDLLLDLPEATWLPVAINADSWRCDEEALGRRTRPRVMHVPSRRNPPIKGTAYVEPVLRRLADQGKITYLAPERLPHDRIAALVKSADIVVDQILTGSYGVAAVEGMAAARLVVGNVAPDVRARMPEDAPIVDAEPDRFEEVMMTIIDERERFAALALEGPAFVGRWHDGSASAEALRKFLRSPVL